MVSPSIKYIEGLVLTSVLVRLSMLNSLRSRFLLTFSH
jgi:hypothetical protein